MTIYRRQHTEHRESNDSRVTVVVNQGRLESGVEKEELPEKTWGGGGSVAGRMTLSGRVVSSERGGRGIPSWWMLVGTNTGGNTVCVLV